MTTDPRDPNTSAHDVNSSHETSAPQADHLPQAVPFAATPPDHVNVVQPLPYGVPEAQSYWPVVVGVIAIVFGAGGLLMGLFTALGSFMFRGMSQMAGAMGQSNPGLAMFSEPHWMLVQGAVGACVAVLLLVGGVGLASRRRYGNRVTWLWSVVKLFSTVVTAYAGYRMQVNQMTAMSQQMGAAGGPPAAMQASMFETVTIFTLIFGLAWGWALPIFMLIWLSRRKVRAEVSEWA